MNKIDYVVTSTTKYIEQMTKAQRKKYGQFFTSKETAVFMAELFDLQSASGAVSILDPGAGSGILSTALIERMLDVAAITKIKLVCYESDTNILELLRSNMDWVCAHASKPIEYEIVADNYILSQMADYNHNLIVCKSDPARPILCVPLCNTAFGCETFLAVRCKCCPYLYKRNELHRHSPIQSQK